VTGLVTTVLLGLAQLVVLLAVAPGLSALIKTAKARVQGRTGPPLGQPYADLFKLLRKDMVVSEHTSWVFSWAPAIYAGALATAALLVPVLWLPAPLAGWGDAVAFIGGVFAASLTWHAILAVLSGSLHGRLGPNARTVLTVVANGVVIALGIRILAQVVAG